MKKAIIIYFIFFLITSLKAEELKKCEWNNSKGKPCLTIFSAPNTSSISEAGLGKIVITKQQIIDYGYTDVRSALESVVGLDVYSDGPRGQKTSIFMRGTNSNHTLVLLNGIGEPFSKMLNLEKIITRIDIVHNHLVERFSVDF